MTSRMQVTACTRCQVPIIGILDDGHYCPVCRAQIVSPRDAALEQRLLGLFVVVQLVATGVGLILLTWMECS